MSPGALKKLTIEHLRGSVLPFTLSFEKGKKLTVIYGENGSGKTTICDAFEFLGKGKVGSLENRGLGTTTRYWHSVGRKSADVSVSLETGDATCSARIHKNDVTVSPLQARPRVEVLRRSQILNLVEARPGDRYAAISRFIDISGVEASEASLRDLLGGLSKNRDIALARVQENEDAIRQLWEAAGKPVGNALTWAGQEAVRDTTGLQAELQALGILRSAYNRIAEYPERLQLAESGLSSALEVAAKAAKALEHCIAQAAEGGGDLIAILEAANSFLAKHPNPSHCPLCESAEKVSGLADKVTQRIQQFSSLLVAKREKELADQVVRTAQARLQDIQNQAAKFGSEFDESRKAYQWANDIPQPAAVCPADIKGIAAWVFSTAHLPGEWERAEAKRRDTSQFFVALRKALATYQTNVQAQMELERLLPRIERALDIVGEERRRFTDAILANIANEVGRLYEAVHPGEGLNKISLELDPNKRASLEIGANFCGQAAPPQAYFCQSHLDTLGLCVFLALASLDDPDATVLVLDDVLASVDEPHVDRLIEMLYTEALRFRHCVITTHYRPWKQKLRWGWLKNGQCHFVELTKWTSANGLTVVRSIPDVERLRQLLVEAPPDPQLVCSKAGVILEAALDFLTLLYECPVPRKTDGRYTLGDLLPSVDKKLRQALKVEALTGKDASGVPTYQATDLAPILEEIARIAQARNVFGCHFTALSFDLLDSDALGFGQQVLALMDLLTDAEAGWPRNSKSGSYWATSGETRRLHPLQKPQ